MGDNQYRPETDPATIGYYAALEARAARARDNLQKFLDPHGKYREIEIANQLIKYRNDEELEGRRLRRELDEGAQRGRIIEEIQREVVLGLVSPRLMKLWIEQDFESLLQKEYREGSHNPRIRFPVDKEVLDVFKRYDRKVTDVMGFVGYFEWRDYVNEEVVVAGIEVSSWGGHEFDKQWYKNEYFERDIRRQFILDLQALAVESKEDKWNIVASKVLPVPDTSF